MRVFFQMEKDILRAKIEGELDMLVAEELRSKLDEELDKRAARHLILDFSKISFIDSSGLGVIVGRYRRLSPIGGLVSIYGANERVYRILELSGINKIMKVQKPTEAFKEV